jgi:hypothetical protein
MPACYVGQHHKPPDRSVDQTGSSIRYPTPSLLATVSDMIAPTKANVIATFSEAKK